MHICTMYYCACRRSLPAILCLLFISVFQSSAFAQQLWSDAGTWPGGKPIAGQNITIPQGTHIILDENSPVLGGLTINGILEFAGKDLELSASWIMLHGSLVIGSESAPFTHKAIITLTGNDPNESVMGMGTRGIMVMGGILELHGYTPEFLWTKINAHATSGSNSVSLVQTPGWNIGDEIIIGPTDFYAAANQASVTQKFEISGINSNSVQLNGSLNAFRWGQLQYATTAGMSLNPANLVSPPLPDSADRITPLILDERAPVGNLTRNIVIQAPNDALWLNNGFGVHVMIMDQGGTAHVEGVEFRRAGQRGILGRYPFHWHMLSYNGTQTLADASGQYLRNSSINSSRNRGIVIHGTNGVLVKNNVVYDIEGHGIFTEDAVERRNIIDSNLVLHVRNPNLAANLVLKQHETGERGSSGFWISNPDNTVSNNLAADCITNGFWLAFPSRPWGESAQVQDSTGGLLNPSRLLFGVFDNNTAHSNRLEGIMLDNVEIDNDGNTAPFQYWSTTDGRNPEWNSGTLRRFTLSRYKTWKNGNNGIWDRAVWPNNYEVVSADNCGRFFAGSGADGVIERCLVVGTSLNHLMNGTDRPVFDETMGGNQTPVAFATYHSAFDIRNNIVVNFPIVSDTRSGAFATEDYYIRPVDKGQVRNVNNLLIASHAGVKLPARFNYYMLACALWDPHNNWGGTGNDNWLVYNTSFFTYGQTPQIVSPGLSVGGVLVNGPFFGINDFEINRANDPEQDLMSLNIDRLDSSYTTVGNLAINEAANTSLLLAHMRHFAAQGNGRYVLQFPGIDTVSDVAFSVENMHTANDSLLLAVEYSGRFAIDQLYSSSWPNFMDSAHANYPQSFNFKHIYTAVASRNDVLTLPGENYWHDTLQNLVWIKIKGGIQQTWNDHEYLPTDDERQYRKFHMRIYGTAKPPLVINSLTDIQKSPGIYPNPVSTELRIKDATGNMAYTITDPNGRECLAGQVVDDGHINLQSLGSGIYFIEIRNGTSIYFAKFVKF